MSLKRRCTLEIPPHPPPAQSCLCHSPVWDLEWFLNAHTQCTLHNLEHAYSRRWVLPSTPPPVSSYLCCVSVNTAVPKCAMKRRAPVLLFCLFFYGNLSIFPSYGIQPLSVWIQHTQHKLGAMRWFNKSFTFLYLNDCLTLADTQKSAT